MQHQLRTKSALVRSLDPKLTAREVVKLAKKQGVKLSLSYVYGVRGVARKSRLDTRPLVIVGRGRNVGKTHESKLRQLIGELGLIRSRGIVDEMERRVA
jgi:hypothetical protein